jgi:iron complex outermembrane receptor protein
VPTLSTADVSSLALADTLSMLDDRLQLTLGLRQQRVEIDQFDGDSGARVNRYDERAYTPVVGALFRFSQDWAAYGNAIEALSPGPTAPDTASNAGEVFAPYKSRQFEVGVKADTGDLGGSLSLFQITQPSGIVDPVTNIYDLDGKQRNRGLELSAFGEPLRGVRLLAGAMWLQARLLKTQDGLYDGNTAVAAPQATFRLGGEYDVAAVSGLTLTARLMHTSRQYQDMDNNRSIPSWNRFDLGVRYATQTLGRPLALRAAIENALDEDYWASANAGQLLLGAPRTLLLSATVDF